MSATIKDVAKLANVSISTVSRVVNNSKPVSPDAKKRVLDAIEELNYKPNEIARSLVTKRSNIIGVIVEDFGMSYISQVLRGVEEVARMYDFDILISCTYGDPVMENRYMRVLLQKQVEGIVVITESNNPERLNNLKALNVPVAYLNRNYRNHSINTTTINNKESLKMVVDYLVKKNHKNILYFGYDKDIDITSERFKREGLSESLEKHGLSKNIVSIDDENEENLNKAYTEIYDNIKNGITAIICYSDEAAISLMNFLYDKGINVPDDVSIIGMGNIEMGNLYRPRLTTVREPLYDYGAVSTRSIIKDIREEEKLPNETVFLPSSIIERESVKTL